jgi:antitoxin ParD1/3/4
MRTNIDIDDALMAEAMKAGPFQTKKDAVEAGLRLLARQAAYREILKWRGRLKWEGEDEADWSAHPVTRMETAGPVQKARRGRR